MVVEKPLFSLSQIKSSPESKWLQWFHCWVPGKGSIASVTTLDFTGVVGSATKIFYSFLSRYAADWNLKKVDEWIEVSPTHAQYYQITQAQKQALEEKIRVGLTTAAQILGEYEMILHDLRKYKEIVNAIKKNDEHRLRAIFVDQVDVHTGEGSLRSIVTRWPTIIYDFMKLKDEENPDEIAKKLNISKAEAVILATKNKLYKEWKELFGKEVVKRYERLQALVNSRKKLVEEYRNWLKPYIARYKMIKLRTELEGERKKMLTSVWEPAGQATFVNGITLWGCAELKTFELGFIERAPPKELVYPYDHVVRDIILYGKLVKVKKPLSSIYPFLKERLPKEEAKRLEVVKAGIVPLHDARKADELADSIVKDWLEGEDWWAGPEYMYYMFLELNIQRFGLKVPAGEVENMVFNLKVNLVSQNILLLKLLELKCREMEFERYLDEIIGVKKEEKRKKEEKKEEKKEGFKIKISNPLKRGPYITQFKEQIEKHMFPAVMEEFHGLREFLLDHMGV